MATTEELQAQITALSARVAAITAPPTDYYTSQHDGEEIDAAVGRALPGGEIDAAIGSKTEIEFLDNTDFTNPVAQAGIGGLHGSVAYAVDRWKLISGTVSGTSNGLTLNGTIRQIREFAIGFAVVPSIEMHSGTATITYDDSTKYCDITSSGGVIERPHLGPQAITDWAKVPKVNRVEELQKCLRYFRRFNFGSYMTIQMGLVINGGTSRYVNLILSMTENFRAAPSCICSLPASQLLSNPNSVSVTSYNFNTTTSIITMQLVLDTTNADYSCIVRSNVSGNFYIDCLADL